MSERIEAESIEVWDCDCGIVNDAVDTECIVCEQPRQEIITPTTPPPARDWKPVVSEKVLVEATVQCMHSDGKHLFVLHEGACNNEDCEGCSILVPLSSIHPMRKEG